MEMLQASNLLWNTLLIVAVLHLLNLVVLKVIVACLWKWVKKCILEFQQL